MYELFARLITRENVEGLGWLEWGACEGLVERAIKEGDRSAFGQMILVGQFVILGKMFGAKRAVADWADMGNE